MPEIPEDTTETSETDAENVEAAENVDTETTEAEAVEAAEAAAVEAAEAAAVEAAAEAPDLEDGEDTDPGASDYETDVRFADLPLSPEVLRGIEARGYEHPTPVQARVLDPALAGRDLIVRSKTGTGKTAAFGVPILEKLEAGADKPQVVALCPTRELALQVADEIAALGKEKGVKVVPIYGGASMQKQIDGLAGSPEVVVGTPGRVLDLLRRGILDLSGVRTRVLDEADEMLSMGFFEEVTSILDKTPDDAQTLLFSATVSPDIEEIIGSYAHDPETILLSGDEFSVEGIDNILYETRSDEPKPRSLVYLIEAEDPPAALIFCNTRDDTAMVSAVLNRQGLDATLINSDLSQKDREKAMAKIKRGELRFLVATDLAARGIDITGLTHVINYSLPEDPAVYMHRVGRTGRIGRAGTAISLYSGRDLATLRALEGKYGVEFDRRRLPDAEEARKHWAERHIKELEGEMRGDVFEAFIPLAREIAGRPNGEFLVAYALKYFFNRRRQDKARESGEVEARPEPRSSRGRGRDGGEGGRGRGRDRDRDRGGRGRGRGERGSRERGERGERGGRDRGGREEADGERPKRRRRRRDGDEPAAQAATEAGAEAAEAGGEETEARDEAASSARLYVGLGSEQGLDADGIRQIVAEAAGADPRAIANVSVADKHTFIDAVDADAARALLEANGKPYGESTLRVEKARPPKRRTRRRRS